MSRTTTFSFSWRRRLNRVLNWVFPSDDRCCVICSRPVIDVSHASSHTLQRGHADLEMCLFCRQELDLCPLQQSHHQLKLSRPRQTLDVYSCVAYDHFIRSLIRAFKYDGVIELRPFFGDLLIDASQDEHLDMVDLVVPVPSSPERTVKRGYDHVRLLTGYLSQHTNLPSKSALLRRPTEAAFTQSQTAKTAMERRVGIQTAYDRNRQVSVRGRNVLLVDDIVTTGSTLSTCAQQLYAAGAHEVIGLVIARVW